MGCIGIGTEAFRNLTPAQFDAICGQWSARQEYLEKERWEQTRWMMWASVRPFAKRLRPTDVMHFGWERKQSETDEKSTRERFERIAELWNDNKYTTENGNE